MNDALLELARETWRTLREARGRGRAMTEGEWLAGDDPRAMLEWVTRSSVPHLQNVPPSDRKLRLFACAIGRGDEDLSDVAIAVQNWLTVMGGGAKEAALLREVAGNPFRPIKFDVTWRTADVSSVATVAYHTRIEDEKATELRILADALEDAGCTEDAILSHLRSAGPHVRGCWALDLILGKT